MLVKASRAYHGRVLRPLLILAAATAVTQPAYAAIYKWIDENGTVVYSNKPPANAKLVKAAKVVVPDDPPKSADAERAERAQREQELLDRLSRLERLLAAQQYAPPVQYAPPAQYAPPVQYAPPPDYYGYGYGMPYYYPPVYPAAVIVRPASRFFVRTVPVRGSFHSHFRR